MRTPEESCNSNNPSEHIANPCNKQVLILMLFFDVICEYYCTSSKLKASFATGKQRQLLFVSVIIATGHYELSLFEWLPGPSPG
jgi:hypothetical protein